MNLKKIGKVGTSKFVGTRLSFYIYIYKKNYRAAVSQRLRNTGLDDKRIYWSYSNGL